MNTKKVKVLQIIPALNAGGTEAVVMNYLRNIDREKIQMDFLVFSPRSYYDDEAETLGSHIFRIPSRRQNLFKNYIQIDHFFDEHPDYTIVHIHQSITYFKPLNAAYKHGVPVRIVHSHGFDIRYRQRLKLFCNYYAIPHVSKLATDYFACSKYAAGQLFTKNIIDHHKYYILNNAINTKKFVFNNQVRKAKRRELNLEDKFVIGHVGRFDFSKNQSFLIDIFKSVTKKEKNAHLLLIGNGENFNQIKQKVDHYGLSDKVNFLGIRNDVAEIMQAMDIFVLPSQFEGLPFVGIEAQTASLPCVFSDAVKEEVKVLDECAFLPLNDSPDVWADQILAFKNVERKNQYKVMTDRGYNIELEAQKLTDFYCQKGEERKNIC